MNAKTCFLLFFIGLVAICIVAPLHSYGQKPAFKTYLNPKHKFSFEIPNNWTIKYSYEQENLVCTPISSKEKESYSDCFEDIVFRLEIYNSTLDSTLLNSVYFKIGKEYYTNDRIRDSIKTTKISGINWKGIYHNNICGISCKENGFHAAGGQCEYLYFSKGKKTICINTNGREFDKLILHHLLKSFKFS